MKDTTSVQAPAANITVAIMRGAARILDLTYAGRERARFCDVQAQLYNVARGYTDSPREALSLACRVAEVWDASAPVRVTGPRHNATYAAVVHSLRVAARKVVATSAA